VQTGIQGLELQKGSWIPASAGMTEMLENLLHPPAIAFSYLFFLFAKISKGSPRTKAASAQRL
jgi:hypothetical protein